MTISLLIKQQKNFDKEQKFQGDKGYQGAEKTITPQKKPRKQEMLPEIKEDNLKLAKKIIFVEHVIRLLKIFGVAWYWFRLKEYNYEKVILAICGLVRLRIGSLILAWTLLYVEKKITKTIDQYGE